MFWNNILLGLLVKIVFYVQEEKTDGVIDLKA